MHADVTVPYTDIKDKVTERRWQTKQTLSVKHLRRLVFARVLCNPPRTYMTQRAVTHRVYIA